MKPLFIKVFMALILLGMLEACFFGSGFYPVVIGNAGHSAGLPSGSYQQSCQDCTAVDHVLSCNCFDRGGALRNSCIDARRCGESISNDNGSLVCEGSSFPHGSYIKSCKKSRYKGALFACSCADRNGNFGHTRIDYGQCGNRSLANIDGNLECEN